MDILQLLQDYSIDHRTEGHKHTREGWVNTPCPWCITDNPGYHLGYNIQGDFFVCWKCGYHPVKSTISKLLKVSIEESQKIIKQYGLIVRGPIVEPSVRIGIKPHKLPGGAGPLTKRHTDYLTSRGFQESILIKDYKLLGTGPISLLDGIDYKNRIIIPFIWNGQQISFDSRDITGKHTAKYMACPANREIIPHKEILYGRQELWGSTGICVEGPTDVWRMGRYSFAVSGIKYTPKQVRVIAKTFDRVAVCFDGGEAQALVQANLLVGDLRFRGVDAFRVDIEGDPGAMSQQDADYLVKQLIK